MRRRALIVALAGAAAWPLAARAQQPDVVMRIGVLGPRPENTGISGGVAAGYPSMLDELGKLGFSKGRNLTIEFRTVEQERPAIFADAAELVRSNANVLVAIGPEVGVQAAVAASATIPIVIAAFNYDPIARGYIKSLAQPGGNITGVFLRQPELAEKQVDLLMQTFPDRTRLAMVWDELSSDQFSAAAKRAKSSGLEVLSTKLERLPYDFVSAFQSLVESSPQMLLVLASPHFIAQRQKIAELAIQYHLPSMYNFTYFVESGGLMSYGVDIIQPFRRAGHHVGKILRGANPAELPVEQVTIFETAINLKTARALGLELPTAVLLRADRVIE